MEGHPKLQSHLRSTTGTAQPSAGRGRQSTAMSRAQQVQHNRKRGAAGTAQSGRMCKQSSGQESQACVVMSCNLHATAPVIPAEIMSSAGISCQSAHLRLWLCTIFCAHLQLILGIRCCNCPSTVLFKKTHHLHTIDTNERRLQLLWIRTQERPHCLQASLPAICLTCFRKSVCQTPTAAYLILTP